MSKKTIVRAPSSGGLKGHRIHNGRSKHLKNVVQSGKSALWSDEFKFVSSHYIQALVWQKKGL